MKIRNYSPFLGTSFRRALFIGFASLRKIGSQHLTTRVNALQALRSLTGLGRQPDLGENGYMRKRAWAGNGDALNSNLENPVGPKDQPILASFKYG